MSTVIEQTLEPVARLTRDLKDAAITLSREEARFLVDAYYIIQENRKRSFNQERALNESEEPHAVISWFADQNRILESQVQRALDAYSGADPLGVWARSVVGIGPVIAAGLLAHIDLSQATTVGHIWRFAGLDPSREWGKGEKRPWNAELKTLCWKIGESFVKFKNHERQFYGTYYEKRKALETVRNERGEFADQAAAKLERFKIGKKTEAYKHYTAGRLPPDHVHSRAKRYAVKLFLSHYHEVGRRLAGEPAVKPFALAQLDHAHYIPPPNVSE